MNRLTMLIFLLTLADILFAQKTVYFNKGLFISRVPHYGREALYSDTLAYRLYNKTLKKPVAGQAFSVSSNGDSLTWKEVNADSANSFRTRGAGRSGYLYLTYKAINEETVLLNIKGNSAVYVNGVLHAGDPYGSGWLYIPVKLKKGENELYVRTYFRTVASIVYPEKSVMISTADSTLPHIVLQK